MEIRRWMTESVPSQNCRDCLLQHNGDGIDDRRDLRHLGKLHFQQILRTFDKSVISQIHFLSNFLAQCHTRN